MRIDKVNQQLKREISQIIQGELSDPRLEFVTITGVSVSKDLRHARVFFSALGGEEKLAAAQIGLNGARGAIRRMVGDRIKMRYTPELNFIVDTTLGFSERIDETIKEINDEHEKDHRNNQEE